MCVECEWEDWASVLEDMIDDKAFGFAYGTLDGISKWVSDNEHITEDQIKAIENIQKTADN